MSQRWVGILSGVTLLGILGCGGGQLASADAQAPTVLSVDPPMGMPGTNITIFGGHFLDWNPPIVKIGGIECQVLSCLDTQMVVGLPNNIAPGPIVVDNGVGKSEGTTDFFVGIPTNVTEIEPNDNVHGFDATLEGANRSVSGTLSSLTDVDHFRIQGMTRAHYYRVHVTPSNIPTILVNNYPQALDSNGNVLVRCSTVNSADLTTWLILGITGFTGNYSMIVTKVP